MTFPRLKIDLKRFKENVVTEVELFRSFGVEIMGVNKVFNGLVPPAKAACEAGLKTIAESRISNLKKLQALPVVKCLLRTPGLSEIKDVVRYADISLNSEFVVIKALAKEALKQNKTHQILLMIDMGDLREGLWFEDINSIERAFESVIQESHLSLYGLGTNFNCYGAVLPSVSNLNQFTVLAKHLENRFQVKIPRLSGGNCTSYHLMDKKQWPPSINHLRIGGLHQFGIEYVEMKYVEGFHHSSQNPQLAVSPLYQLEAEIIELNTKPTVPFGEQSVDAFLNKKHFEDFGPRKRALLALGRQDIALGHFWPSERSFKVLGQTSDHTVLDIEPSHISSGIPTNAQDHPKNSDLKVGSIVTFEIDYTGLLMVCNSSGIEKTFYE